MNSIGERIAHARKLKKMSQRDLGRAIGVSVQAVSQWESNRTNPGIGRLTDIGRALDVPLAWLWGHTVAIGTRWAEDGTVPLMAFKDTYLLGIIGADVAFSTTEPPIKPTVPGEGRAFAVQVSEGVAAARFEVGDLLIFDTQKANVRDGDYVIALLFDGGAVKPVLRLYRPSGDGGFLLEGLSDNQESYKLGQKNIPVMVVVAKLIEHRRFRDPVEFVIK